MKMTRKVTMMLFAVCFAAVCILYPQDAKAAKLGSYAQAQKMALEKVPGATVTDADRDYENGVLVYEIELVKGNKTYDLTYRASDAKLIEYEWEKKYVGASKNKAIIGESKCRQLAEKKVPNGTILSISQKMDDGIDIYKVKMKVGGKSYTLKFHARTGALIEYKWKVKATASSSSNEGKGYIGLSKAMSIAKNAVPGAAIIKAEFDMDDGVPVYEIEMIKGKYEYELKIHAETGKILEKEKDWID